MKAHEGEDSEGEVRECIICMSDESTETLPLKPLSYWNQRLDVNCLCRDLAHWQCLDTWLKENGSCPVCRSEINQPNARGRHLSRVAPEVIVDIALPVRYVAPNHAMLPPIQGELQDIEHERFEYVRAEPRPPPPPIPRDINMPVGEINPRPQRGAGRRARYSINNLSLGLLIVLILLFCCWRFL